MKNLLFKSFIFIGILVSAIIAYGYIAIISLDDNFYNSYGRGLEIKYNKLESIKTDKIVITGGSNVAFGIDSDIMESELDMPIVNMGFHAANKTYNNTEPIVPFLNKGDVFILSPEVGLKLYGSSMEVANNIFFIPWSSKWKILKNKDALAPINLRLIKYSQNNIFAFFEKKHQLINRSTFSYYGFKNDNLRENTIENVMSFDKYNSIKKRHPPNIDDRSSLIKYYRSLNNRLTTRGVKVFFLLPNTSENSFDKSELVNFYKTLSNKTGIRLLSNKTYTFQREYLKDTYYHTNTKGRKIKSLLVSSELSKSLNLNKYNFLNKVIVTRDTVHHKIKINQILNGKLKDDIITITKQSSNLNNNYYRAGYKGDLFSNKNMSLTIKADSLLVKDIYFRTFGGLNDWNKVKKINNNTFTLIKTNINTSYYKGNSYLGLGIKDLDKHIGKKIKIVDFYVSDYLSEQKIVWNLPINNMNFYTISTNQNIHINEAFIGIEKSNLILNSKAKYSFCTEHNYLKIKNLYSGESYKVKISDKKNLAIDSKKDNIFEVYISQKKETQS